MGTVSCRDKSTIFRSREVDALKFTLQFEKKKKSESVTQGPTSSCQKTFVNERVDHTWQNTKLDGLCFHITISDFSSTSSSQFWERR